jgi:hypothetical protein
MYDMGPTALLPLRRKCVLGISITHKNPPPSAGPELVTESPVGPVANTLTTRPPRAAICNIFNKIKICNKYYIVSFPISVCVDKKWNVYLAACTYVLIGMSYVSSQFLRMETACTHDVGFIPYNLLQSPDISSRLVFIRA